MRYFLLTFAAGISIALTGCIQVGRSFDVAGVDRLTPGVSTINDAERLLGEPTTIQTNPANGHQALIWRYVYGTGLGTGGGEQAIVSFDRYGRMIAVLQRTKL